MQLKDKADVELAINQTCFQATGFAAVAGSSKTDEVLACCAGVDGDTAAAIEAFCSGAAMEAAPFLLILQLAVQLIPIVFGPDGFTPEKLQAILTLIQQIFV